MVSIPGVPPFAMWAGFIFLILIFLIFDLGLFNRKKHALSIREALLWSLVWFSLAMAFNAFVYFEFGQKVALEFFTGYLVEKSLSVDNLFVMLLIFTSLKVDPKYQHKVLFWGIVGALVMRGLMIGAGTALVARFHWVLYIFGAFLIYAGLRIFFKKDDEDFDPHEHFMVKAIRRVFPVSKHDRGGRFFVKHKGKMAVTVLFIALLIIEVTDIVFAFDSIPAIFGITLDPFIVFTSNIFAILGLRSLYFVILKAHNYFAYLNIGLGLILVFIGLKMLVEKYVEISIFYSLGIIVAILSVCIGVSLIWPPEKQKS